jgi:YfiH family protein
MPDPVKQNRALVSSLLRVDPSRITCPGQQHTAIVEELSGESEIGSGALSEKTAFDPCDGLLTALKNAPILLHFADCAPVVLTAEDGRGRPVLAVLHAGRRGLVEGVVEKGVDAMVRAYNLKPESIVAAVGPAIGACCYQVGEEVAAEFESRFGEDVLRRGDDRVWLDIQSAAGVALNGAAVLSENVHVLEICTSCDSDFYSFRRDGVTGRHGAIAWIE